jgi:hypothetical protein
VTVKTSHTFNPLSKQLLSDVHHLSVYGTHYALRDFRFPALAVAARFWATGRNL